MATNRDQIPQTAVAINPADVKPSTTSSDDDDLLSSGHRGIVHSDIIVSEEMQPCLAEGHEKADYDEVSGLNNRPPTATGVDQEDGIDDCSSCCIGGWCSRRCSKYWNDKKTACRTCGTGSRQFVGEVGDMLRKVDFCQRAKRMLTLQNLMDRVPITKWLPKYRLSYIQSDIVAGLAVGLTAIPQSIAYAKVAGLQPQYGLYTSIMGAFIYTLFGSSKDISIGPVAIISLLVASLAQSPIPGDATYAILVSLVGGSLQLFMGLFRLGFILDYISHPIVNSFTTTSALTIAEGQLKKWLGLKVKLPRDFFNELIGTLKNIPNANPYDFSLGLICIITLCVLKMRKCWFARQEVKDIKLRNPKNSRLKRAVQYCIWLTGTARNAIVVLLSATASAIFAAYNLYPFSASNDTPPGLPPFQVPKFSLGPPLINETYTTSDIFSSIGKGFVIIPLLGVLEAVAIGKSFAEKHGYRLDPNQELIAIGIGNIMGSFVSAYPATGSFSRTSVNAQSGVQTPAGGIVCGLVVILALLFLTPYFNYIPDAALAAVIICAVVDLVDFSLLAKLWRINKAEIFPWFLTFFFGLGLGAEYGIIVGVGWTLLVLLWPWNRPNIQVVRDEQLCIEKVVDNTQQGGPSGRIIVMSISHGNLFPSIERLKDKISQQGAEVNSVVLDFSMVSFFDYTIIEGLGHLISEFAKVGNMCIIAYVKPEILEAFEKAKLKHFHHASSMEEAVQQIRDHHSTRRGYTSKDGDAFDGISDVVAVH